MTQMQETLPLAPATLWGWDTCVVCGSKTVTDYGLIFGNTKREGVWLGRVAWCERETCRTDLDTTKVLLLSSEEVAAVESTVAPVNPIQVHTDIWEKYHKPHGITLAESKADWLEMLNQDPTMKQILSWGDSLAGRVTPAGIAAFRIWLEGDTP